MSIAAIQIRKTILILVLLSTSCGSSAPKAGDIRVASEDGMEILFVPAGQFEMGSTSDAIGAGEDETPLHRIYLDAFWVDRTEVTNDMYQQCILADICTPPAQTKFYTEPGYNNHPVIGVSWDQANIYCGWAGRRLPSEAEWEKAARGTDSRIYPWGNEAPAPYLANFDHMINETTPVGNYPQGASPYGALDMAGNAWEWTADGYSPDFYSDSPSTNPVSDSPVNRRVLRGGNWDSNAEGIRAANRFWAYPGRNDTDGFRCAKSE